jgi:hypothetical protein
MNFFKIKAYEDDLASVRKMLSDLKGSGSRVIMRATNKTLTGVKTDASAAIRQTVTAKKAAVDDTFKISKATIDKPSASIASTGRPVGLINFSSNQTKKGVSVQVRKDRPRKIVPGAFIATMKSGHKGVFWRKYHQTGGKLKKNDTLINQSGFIYSTKLKRFISAAWLPKEYRLPIRELFGPRIPDIMENVPVMNDILSKAGDRLHKNLMHETEYELSKIGK